MDLTTFDPDSHPQVYAVWVLDVLILFGNFKKCTHYITDLTFMSPRDAQTYMDKHHPTKMYRLQPVSLDQLREMPFVRIVTDPTRRQSQRIK